ncbi:MAG: HAMP domain-containing sensor histidine kinase [Solirubrobacteraceae bacterium]
MARRLTSLVDPRTFRTLRFRLTVSFASVVALVLAATGVLIYVQFSRDLDRRIDDDLGDRQVVVVGLSKGSSPLRVIELSGEPLMQLYDASGRVVASSRRVEGHTILTAEEIRRARTRTVIADHDHVPGTDDGGRLHAFAVAQDGVAVIVEPLDDREVALHRLALLLLFTLPGALILASLAGSQVARGALRPVERMRARAAGIGAGDSTQRLPEPGTHDELDRLAITLNDLLDRLDHALVRERRIVGDASHELRTPIAVLRTRIDVALRDGDDDPARLRAVLAETREDAERLSRLADDLLVLARADQGELPLRPELLDVQALLEHAAARHAPQAEAASRPLTLDNRIDGGAVLLADPDRAAQALDNLIVNALRYGAGPIDLSAELADPIGPARPGDSGGDPSPTGLVAIHVRDHGAGFPEAFLPVAFQRFSQADNAHGGPGTGLGLAIVDAVARAQGGTARVANHPDGGAVATLTLPLA